MDDKKNITDEEIGLKVITELTKIVDFNRKSFAEAKAHRDWVDSEIRVPHIYLSYLLLRLTSISLIGHMLELRNLQRDQLTFRK